MKYFVDLNDCLIELFFNDVIDEFFFFEEDLLEDSFENLMLFDLELELNEVFFLYVIKLVLVVEFNFQMVFLIDNQMVFNVEKFIDILYFDNCSV